MASDLDALMSAVIDDVGLACINAVAALIDVGGEFGHRLEPLTVRASIFNPKLSEQVGDFSDLDAESRLKERAREEGTAIVKLGIGEAPAGEWPGHLVALMDTTEPKKKILLDPTLPQVNQPAYDIILNPLVLTVPAARIAKAGYLSLRVNGCTMLYRFFPSDRSFEYTKAWSDWYRRKSVRDRVLERMKSAV